MIGDEAVVFERKSSIVSRFLTESVAQEDRQCFPHPLAHTHTHTPFCCTISVCHSACVCSKRVWFYMCEHNAISCLVFWQSASHLRCRKMKLYSCYLKQKYFLIKTCKITFFNAFHQYFCHFPINLSILKCLIHYYLKKKIFICLVKREIVN